MKFKKIALLAMSTLALAACGGGGDVFTPVVAPIDAPIDAAPHIKGTVAGAMFNATANVGGEWAAVGEMAGLYAELPQAPVDNHAAHWGIYGLKAALGSYSCGLATDETSLQIDLHDTVNNSWYETYGGATGACTVTVKAVSETEISGTFKATLVRDNDASMTVNVSDGTFRVPRTDLGGPR